jgi:iron-sulfur cluster repair protein YtfE (RIC family)
MLDPFTLLELDHREVEQLLELLAESAEGPDREKVVRQLDEALSVHMQFEERHLYPLLCEAVDDEAAQEAAIEHALARDGLTKLGQLVSAPGFGAAVEMLKGGINHHVQEEEGELFPVLREHLDGQQRETLASRLFDEKRAAGLPVIDIDHATKNDLLELARTAGIEGRSRMTKNELVDALAGRGERSS